MSNKGKDIEVPDLSSFSHAEWARVLREVNEMDCWRRQDGESLFHHRERIRMIYSHARVQLGVLEEAQVEVEAQPKDRNPDPLTIPTPDPSFIPTPGARGSTVVDPAPVVRTFPRGLVQENEVVVETESEEDPEEDPEEEQEEEVEVVVLSDDEMEGVDAGAHPVPVSSEEEADDDFMMWEEEPPTPELVILSDVDSEEAVMEEVEEEEDMEDPDYAQFLAQIGVWGVPAEAVEPEDAAVDPEVETSEDESDGSSSTDGGDSGDDPDFEPSSYHERSDYLDGLAV